MTSSLTLAPPSSCLRCTSACATFVIARGDTEENQKVCSRLVESFNWEFRAVWTFGFPLISNSEAIKTLLHQLTVLSLHRRPGWWRQQQQVLLLLLQVACWHFCTLRELFRHFRVLGRNPLHYPTDFLVRSRCVRKSLLVPRWILATIMAQSYFFNGPLNCPPPGHPLSKFQSKRGWGRGRSWGLAMSLR